jgi:hypothetical protein
MTGNPQAAESDETDTTAVARRVGGLDCTTDLSDAEVQVPPPPPAMSTVWNIAEVKLALVELDDVTDEEFRNEANNFVQDANHLEISLFRAHYRHRIRRDRQPSYRHRDVSS